MVLLAAVAATMVMTGCTEKKNAAPAQEAEQTPADSMVYGHCGEGTAMNTLELVTPDGHSTTYTLDDGEQTTEALGGLNAGDSMAVMAGGNIDGMPVAREVVNITSLMGRWSSLDYSFALLDGGKMTSEGREALPAGNWRLLNGKLIIGETAYTIKTLGPDSLYLVNGKTTTGYRRLSPAK